jgi:hypothetical protein
MKDGFLWSVKVLFSLLHSNIVMLCIFHFLISHNCLLLHLLMISFDPCIILLLMIHSLYPVIIKEFHWISLHPSR